MVEKIDIEEIKDKITEVNSANLLGTDNTKSEEETKAAIDSNLLIIPL